MADKDKLAAGLAADQARPQIRRGGGVTLSTQQAEPDAETQQRSNTESQERSNARTQQRKNAASQERSIAASQDNTNAVTQNSGNAESQNHTNAATQDSENAQSHNRASAKSQNKTKRVNRGYQLREDLIKDMRRVALNEDRKLYEVMEEAISDYLERKGSQQ